MRAPFVLFRVKHAWVVLAQCLLDLRKVIYEAMPPLAQRARIVWPDVRDRIDDQLAGRRAV